ncbi:MAG TPA: mandelate racemase/muconate lactonizing enzyme family protein [Capsulimonadaceae bacterium]|nr:mandelate racemase/muconate lactonizing enzyme family protein [Capsulimonadaceae bacterium]
MKIESLDFFYLSMPEVLDIGDGSQDALLVRVRAGGYEGWGECEASPLTSIAGLVCPLSHSACKPVQDSVLGQTLDQIADVARIGNLVRANSFDLLQADHILSGIDIALWDLMGRAHEEPVYKLLGYDTAYRKMPYASMLFGAIPHETLEKAKQARSAGYQAVKFGWAGFGAGSVESDEAQVIAAREGVGKEAVLLIDAGTVWGADIHPAALRIPILQECGVTWLEEPFASGALSSYSRLAQMSGKVRLAGGEGSHNPHMARHMIDYGAVGYIQIDTGRIGGISAAKEVVDYAVERGVTYVNHTFTSYLALAASLAPYAGVRESILCEYPVEAKPLARDLTHSTIVPGDDGLIALPEGPGLGITPSLDAIKRYLVDVEIKVGGKLLYRSPEV